MKFHCDRCKTRYSISDDRVDGKILKIRCKNCSSIIKVSKENLPSGDSIGDVSRDTSGAPSRLDDDIVSEWYLAIDGNQSGPFNLEGAKNWIIGKSADIAIHCWAEGFSEWKLVDQVSHFRGLRDGKALASVDSSAPFLSDDNLIPELDEADDEWAKNISTQIEPSGTSALEAVQALNESAAAKRDAAAAIKEPSSAPKVEDSSLFQSVESESESDALDFDIGEASRVVQLPDMLERLRGPAASAYAGAQSGAALPGTSNPGEPLAPGFQGASPNPTNEKKKRGLLLLLLAGGGLIALGVLLFVLKQASSNIDGDEIARGNVGGEGNLGLQFQNPSTGKTKTSDETQPDKSTGRVRKTVRRIPNKNVSASTSTQSSTSTSRSGGGEEVSFGQEAVATGPLDGSDLVKVYKKYQFHIKRCYERALKQDPFLKVRKTDVKIQVAPSGQVSSVKIQSLSGTPLGKCLESSIKRWRFRTSSETFNGQFPVVFGS